MKPPGRERFTRQFEAMEQRRLTPVNGAEEAALMSAEEEVQVLVAEMTAKYV